MDRSYYEILGVKEAADRRAIRAAYLKKIKVSHPDRARRGKAAEARAAAINLAYFILRDPRRRLAYDLDLKRQRNGAAPAGRPTALWEPRAIPVRTAPAPPPRSRKAMASAVLLGAAILGLLLVIADIEPPAPPPRQTVAAVADDAAPAVSDDSLWVDRAMVDRAVDTLVLIRAHGGAGDALAYSRNCYSQLASRPRLLLLDHCLAFDVAAATWRRDAMGEVDFAPAAMVPRQAAALRQLVPAERRRDRLQEVNAATLAALARRVRPPAERNEVEADAYGDGGEAAALAATH